MKYMHDAQLVAVDFILSRTMTAEMEASGVTQESILLSVEEARKFQCEPIRRYPRANTSKHMMTWPKEEGGKKYLAVRSDLLRKKLPHEPIQLIKRSWNGRTVILLFPFAVESI